MGNAADKPSREEEGEEEGEEEQKKKNPSDYLSDMDPKEIREIMADYMSINEVRSGAKHHPVLDTFNKKYDQACKSDTKDCAGKYRIDKTAATIQDSQCRQRCIENGIKVLSNYLAKYKGDTLWSVYTNYAPIKSLNKRGWEESPDRRLCIVIETIKVVGDYRTLRMSVKTTAVRSVLPFLLSRDQKLADDLSMIATRQATKKLVPVSPGSPSKPNPSQRFEELKISDNTDSSIIPSDLIVTETFFKHYFAPLVRVDSDTMDQFVFEMPKVKTSYLVTLLLGWADSLKIYVPNIKGLVRDVRAGADLIVKQAAMIRSIIGTDLPIACLEYNFEDLKDYDRTDPSEILYEGGVELQLTTIRHNYQL